LWDKFGQTWLGVAEMGTGHSWNDYRSTSAGLFFGIIVPDCTQEEKKKRLKFSNKL